ncbi:MAG: DNA-binding response regulator [Alkalicoccus sp.]|nr:MAG: DNA-binding response regulator [Alkalicoccus sp.]
MKGKTILVIEKNSSYREEINYALKGAGFDVWETGSSEALFGPLSHLSPDGIVLDGNMTDKTGNFISSKIRKLMHDVPLIVMTENPEELEVVLHLERGADDCMLKPGRPRELVSRMRTLLRRVTNDCAAGEIRISSGLVTNGDIKVNLLNHKVYAEEKELAMSSRERALLTFLVLNQNRLFSRKKLLDAVMEKKEGRSSRMVDALISRIRDKIEPNSRRPVYIKTVRKMGYMMESIPAAGKEG